MAALFPGPCPHVQRWPPSARSARRCIRSRSNLAVTPTLRSRNETVVQNRFRTRAASLRERLEERIHATFPEKKNGEQRADTRRTIPYFSISTRSETAACKSTFVRSFIHSFSLVRSNARKTARDILAENLPNNGICAANPGSINVDIGDAITNTRRAWKKRRRQRVSCLASRRWSRL